MDAILLLSDETSIAYKDCMMMPTHIFVAMCNKTAKLIQDRHDKEQSEMDDARNNSNFSMPSIPSSFNLPDLPKFN